MVAVQHNQWFIKLLKYHKMKTIQPVVFPLNLGTAIILNAYCINDNLSSSANFYYQLLSDNKSQLQEGNLTIIG